MIILDDAFAEDNGSIIVLRDEFPLHTSASLHLKHAQPHGYDLVIDFKDEQAVETECYCISGISKQTATYLLDNRAVSVFADTGESLCAKLSSVPLDVALNVESFK